jgi:cytoskeleton protein RodZ
MTKKEQEESPKKEAIEAKAESQKAIGLGELFKREREKMGLSREQVVEVTRLRKHFVEALENEDWENLPSGVFVRGFITSYAQVVGVDEKRALELYEKSMPAKSLAPRPLVKRPKAKIGPFFFLAFLLIGVAVLILWILYPFSIYSPLQPEITPPPEPRQEPSTATETEVPEPKKPEVETKIAEITEEAKVEPDQTDQKEQASEVASLEVETPAEPMVIAPKTTEPASEAEEGEARFVLTGHVKARTWIRICVDQQEPKEYIFQPGSRPQWKGMDGFNVLIGNAAGVEFDFNEKRLENLGDLGRVVRLKLPENFEGSKCEE